MPQFRKCLACNARVGRRNSRTPAGIVRAGICMAVAILPAVGSAQIKPPVDNPVAKYNLTWTEAINWTNVVTIEGTNPAAVVSQLAAAQDSLARQGGGVVYFPAGTYEFRDNIEIRSGVVIRGAVTNAGGVKTPLQDGYLPPTQFVFPRYSPTFTGSGTPNDTAFKGVHLADPAGGSNCGIVNVDLVNGHVEFGTTNVLAPAVAAGKAGRGGIVYGCLVRAAAVPDASIPWPFQHKWQRWTDRYHGAIHVCMGGDVLVANNRIPFSTNAAFTMPGYRLYRNSAKKSQVAMTTNDFSDVEYKEIEEREVVFDYDNRPGISVNSVPAGDQLAVWNAYTNKPPKPESQPEPPPHALCKGIVVRDNYVCNTACPGIIVTGDGAVIAGNVIRFRQGVWRATTRGYQTDHFTSDTRAIELRGYRWTVEGNDYQVHRNHTVARPGLQYNDGEGIMHEAWNNCGVKDSKLINNRGNAYLCIWRVPVDGLEVRGNRVPFIRLFGRSGDTLLPCANVQVVSNVTDTAEGGITVQGVASNVVIRGNTRPAGQVTLDTGESAVDVGENPGYVTERKVLKW